MIKTRTVVLLVLAALVVGVVIFRAVGLNEPMSTAGPPAPSSSGTPTIAVSTPSADEEDSGSDNHPHEHLYSRTEDARRQWTPVIEGFGRNFTANTASPPTWRARLKPYATVEVQRYLASVDPANVPIGRYTGFEILEYHDHQLAAKVTYAEGWAMVLYLVDEVSAWRIHRYDRYEE